MPGRHTSGHPARRPIPAPKLEDPKAVRAMLTPVKNILGDPRKENLMDVATIANDAMLLLTPVLPYLVEKTRDVAAGEATKKVGKKTWDAARGLWDELRPAVEANA